MSEEAPHHPALAGPNRRAGGWAKALAKMLAEGNVLELRRMADIADRVQEALAWSDFRIAGLERDIALGHSEEGAINITRLIQSIADGTTWSRVFHAASALTRPAGELGASPEYVIVTEARAAQLKAAGAYVHDDFFGLCVWVRPSEPMPDAKREIP